MHQVYNDIVYHYDLILNFIGYIPFKINKL